MTVAAFLTSLAADYFEPPGPRHDPVMARTCRDYATIALGTGTSPAPLPDAKAKPKKRPSAQT